jgi:hypothetical protein
MSLDTHLTKLSWLLLGAATWVLPATAERLTGMPAPVEWLSGPADGAAGTGQGGANAGPIARSSVYAADGYRQFNAARPGCTPGVETSASDVRALIARIASAEGADPKLADAVAAQESRYDQKQISPKGAIGVMQLMPEMAKHYEVDPCELEANIRGGVRYLRDLSAEFGGNVMLVLAAYNACRRSPRRCAT